MSQITTVIFDMYETLVENGPHLWQATFQEIIDSQQLPVSTGDLWREWKVAEVNFRNRRLEPDSPFESYFEGWRDCFVKAFRVFGLNGDPEAASHRSILDMSLRAPYEETVEALEAIQDDYGQDVVRLKLEGNEGNSRALSQIAEVDHVNDFPGRYRYDRCRLRRIDHRVSTRNDESGGPVG